MQNDIISCLQKHYPNQEVHLIGSGWSSDAFEVGNKIIRVPKAGLEQYEKEVIILDFLQGRLPVQIPHPRLIKKDNLVYAEHTKIEGLSWNISTYNALSEEKQDAFAKDIAHFFATLHSIPIDEIYKSVPKELLAPYALIDLQRLKAGLRSEFSEKEIATLYSVSKKILEADLHPVLLHKDFYEANVVVDSNHRLSGVFDWANACVGKREWDFKALYHPVYMHLFDKVINYYDQETGVKITKASINRLKIADSLLCAQYFVENPKLKYRMPEEWQRTLAKFYKSLLIIDRKPSLRRILEKEG